MRGQPRRQAGINSPARRPQNKWLVLTFCATAYFIVYFHRVSTSALVADLRHDLGLTASQLGLLSSMYFYAYALSQVPNGFLTDRIGAKKMILTGSVIAVAGALLFAAARSFPLLILARIITSIGVAAIYVPTLRLLIDAFDARRLSTAIGLLLITGNLGALAASSPLALSAQIVGWRGSMVAVAVLTTVIAGVVLLFLRADSRDVPRDDATSISDPAYVGPPSGRTQWWGLGLLGAINFFMYGPVMGFQGLWGIPFFTDAGNMSKVAAGNVIAMIPLGYILGSLLAGILTNQLNLRKGAVALSAAGGTLLAWLPLVLPFAFSLPLRYICSFLIGMLGAINGVTVLSMGPLFLGVRNKGAALGFLNTCSIGGGAIFPLAMGWIIDAAARTSSTFAAPYYAAFRFAFGGLVLGAVGSGALLAWQLAKRRTD